MSERPGLIIGDRMKAVPRGASDFDECFPTLGVHVAFVRDGVPARAALWAAFIWPKSIGDA